MKIKTCGHRYLDPASILHTYLSLGGFPVVSVPLLASVKLPCNYHPFCPFTETRHCQAVISGNIVTDIYSIRRIPFATRKAKYAEVERRLDQWFIGLPDQLRYDGTSRRAAVPPPHILFLNIRYWAVVLLLNRALYVACVNIYIY